MSIWMVIGGKLVMCMVGVLMVAVVRLSMSISTVEVSVAVVVSWVVLLVLTSVD